MFDFFSPVCYNETTEGASDITEGENMMNLSSKIRELRKARNLTQEQLAAALNISPQAVSKWEMGGPKLKERDACVFPGTIQQTETERIQTARPERNRKTSGRT